LGPGFNETLIRSVENQKSLIFHALLSPRPDQVSEASTLLNSISKAMMTNGLVYVTAGEEELQ
jgi:hypothetical protein